MVGREGTLNPSTTAAILLAAGGSVRFSGDKLAAKIGDDTILALSASALAQSRCALRAAIVGEQPSGHVARVKTLGFTVIFNSKAKQGMSTSIRAGVEWAHSRGAEAVLIALADMPFVSPAHYGRLFEKAAGGENAIVYSHDGRRRSPPVIFSAERFDDLMALEGEAGARALIQAAPASNGVAAPREMLADIDTADDLRRAARRPAWQGRRGV